MREPTVTSLEQPLRAAPPGTPGIGRAGAGLRHAAGPEDDGKVRSELEAGRRMMERQVIDLARAREANERQHGQLVALAEALRKERDRAEEANRAKSSFLATMSHEIRTPLNGILGLTDVLARGALTASQREHIELVRSAGAILTDLLNDVLDLSKVEAGCLELDAVDFDAFALVSETAGLWAERARAKGLTLDVEGLGAEPAWLRGDPGRIRQVLSNYLSNALKFTETGGIRVRLSLGEAEGGRRAVRVEVEDTGIGLSPEAAGHVFEAFRQADAATGRLYGGTGLGLAICRELCALMGGAVGLDSTSREGSRFWFTVVCEAGQPVAAAARDHAAAGAVPARAAPLKILIAEDNHINRKVMQALLKPLAAELEFVENGRAAVEAVGRTAYDVVLMDIEMPGLDGVQAAQEIRRNGHAAVPIVAITANAMKGDRERYLAAGLDGYVSKPIMPAELFEAIRGCIEGRR